ncbi:MAG: hypothetical protein HY537_06695 [Deltaproteobacteria bacterium]|nr:hypothetical protein [Deltaproteobacteria bacterium]
MRNLFVCIKAVVLAVRKFFAPMDPVGSISANGFSILPGWDTAPEERIIELCRKPAGSLPTRLGLYGLEGTHSGELFLLGSSVETVGVTTGCTKVVTPKLGYQQEQVQLLLNGCVKVLTGPGHFVIVNGEDTLKADLLDYDEVRLLGNRFLVLDFDLNSAATQPASEATHE